jgi:hypothetical protein
MLKAQISREEHCKNREYKILTSTAYETIIMRVVLRVFQACYYLSIIEGRRWRVLRTGPHKQEVTGAYIKLHNENIPFT